jgi:hypothetical protein
MSHRRQDDLVHFPPDNVAIVAVMGTAQLSATRIYASTPMLGLRFRPVTDARGERAD